MAGMLRMVFALLRIAVAVVVVAVTLLVVFQGKLVWVPSGAPEVTPSLLKIPYRDVTLTTRDGVALHAWLLPAEEPRGLLVFCHGNGGSIGDRIDDGAALRRLGFTTLLFDYRGYGGNGGSLSEEGTYLDAEAAYDFLAALPAEGGAAPAKSLPPSKPLPIVAFGESLGGAVSIWLATQRPCAGVAVVSTFTCLSDVARVHYGPLAAVVGSRFDSRARLRELETPLFVAHGDRDEVVPYELGERLFVEAPEPKRFFRAVGAYHNDVFAAPGLIAAIVAFARSVTSAA
jgi:fermentation-respiration switch protein FrsA (DUF1100 family)